MRLVNGSREQEIWIQHLDTGDVVGGRRARCWGGQHLTLALKLCVCISVTQMALQSTCRTEGKCALDAGIEQSTKYSECCTSSFILEEVFSTLSRDNYNICVYFNIL